MTGTAQERQVVEVRSTFGRGMPRNDVVGLAPLKRRPAQNASTVAYHQRQKLGGRSVAPSSAQPERSAVEPHNHGRQITGRRQVAQEPIADRAAADLDGSVPIRAAPSEVIDPDRDHDRRPRRLAAPTAATEPATGCIESPVIERRMLLGGTFTPTRRPVGAVGIVVQQRPELVDECVRALDAETGQTGVGPARRNRVPAHPPGRHLGFVYGVGIGGRRAPAQILLDLSGRLIGVEAAGPIDQPGGNLAGELVGRLRQRIDTVTAELPIAGPGSQLRIGGQRRGSTGVPVDRSTGSPGPTARQVRPGSTPLGPGITIGPRQPGNSQQAGRLQPLFEPRRERNEPPITHPGHVGQQRIETIRQLLDCRLSAGISAGISAGMSARYIQHFHTDNSNNVQ